MYAYNIVSCDHPFCLFSLYAINTKNLIWSNLNGRLIALTLTCTNPPVFGEFCINFEIATLASGKYTSINIITEFCEFMPTQSLAHSGFRLIIKQHSRFVNY